MKPTLSASAITHYELNNENIHVMLQAGLQEVQGVTFQESKFKMVFITSLY